MKTFKSFSTKVLDDGKGFILKSKHCGYALATIKHKNEEGIPIRKLGVSLCHGCLVGCAYCFTKSIKDYGFFWHSDILEQVDFLVKQDRHNPYYSKMKTKVSFKQMGDPLTNQNNTIEAIKSIHEKYPDFSFVVSTSGPKIKSKYVSFFRDLSKLDCDIRLQFSCHTTSDIERKKLSPEWPMMSFKEIATQTRKWNKGLVTLNFVMIQGYEYSADKIIKLFSPDDVFIKINYIDVNKFTNRLKLVDYRDSMYDFINGLKKDGFRIGFRCKG